MKIRNYTILFNNNLIKIKLISNNQGFMDSKVFMKKMTNMKKWKSKKMMKNFLLKNGKIERNTNCKFFL